MLGRHHPLVARLKALRRDAVRRRTEGVIVAEGVHLVREALRHGADVECVVVAPRLDRTPEGRALSHEIAERGLDAIESSDALLDTLQDARSPQPVLAVVRVRPWPLADVLAPPPDRASCLVVVADRVQDPGNLGAILRTADAAGASGLVACGESADLHHPRLVRATMGSRFRLPAAAATGDAVRGAIAERGIRAVAAVPRGGTPYTACDLTGPVALLLGGEGAGLGAEWLEHAEVRVHVPMRAGVDSLSVGAAAAILLFEAARQRGT
jgi:TrmH family RNA methyltransferase